MSLSANFEAHTLQNDFVVFFRLGVEDENGQALFSSLEAFTSEIQGKTVRHGSHLRQNLDHRAPTQSVCVADCYFIVNVLDLPFASPIAIFR